jgi:hypothetical protein
VIKHGFQPFFEQTSVHPSVRERSRSVVEDVGHEVESGEFARDRSRVDRQRRDQQICDLKKFT